MPAIAGVRLATAAAGIKYQDRTDVLLALFDPGTAVAGVFTRSKCPSAPVEWCRAKLKGGKARALVVNSGNANAFTGKTGRAGLPVHREARRQRRRLQAGRGLPRLDRRDRRAARRHGVRRRDGEAGRPTRAAGRWLDAAKAIMTTDTFPKVATAKAKIGKATVTINGIAKGAGMIAPDMATMLSFVFTDAPIARAARCRRCSREGVADTFNAVTIDGDTSTSDTLLVFATGAATRRAAHQQAPTTRGSRHFRKALDERAGQSRRAGGARRRRRAQAGRDQGRGRGVRRPRRARSRMSIANSPLVKTAIAGEDANWGRVVMAVGKAGEPADRDKLSIWFGGIRVAHKGARDPAYDEGDGVAGDEEPEDRAQGRARPRPRRATAC